MLRQEDFSSETGWHTEVDPDFVFEFKYGGYRITVNIVNAEEKHAEIVITDDMLSLAIGKSGQNARLAARFARQVDLPAINRAAR